MNNVIYKRDGDMRSLRTTTTYSGCLLIVAALAVGCGSDSNSNNNNSNTNTSCVDHSDCGDNEVCDPDSLLCVGNACGDGFLRGGEDCDDGVDNGVSPSACMSDCTLTECGDGYLGGSEACDGSALDGATCLSETGHASGELACGSNCDFATDACYSCGDDALDGPESCDGTNFGGATCIDHSFDGGTLTCQADCLSVAVANCTTCGDGACEINKGETTLTCQVDCGWVSIAAGGRGNTGTGNHTCGVKGDGTIWCWGRNEGGQLGNGTFDSTSIPTQVALIDDAVTVSLGDYHSCALKAGGDVDCWGQNYEGQLGIGSYLLSSIPEPVLMALSAIKVDAGFDHTCAVVVDGGQFSTVCWGMNGRLGNGLNVGSTFPVAVLAPVRGVSAGDTHSCGIHVADGNPWCWGFNAFAQIGDGTTDPALAPVIVAPPNSLSVTQVGAGENHSCALLTDGTVSCWGKNGFGALGTDSTNPSWQSSIVPIAVAGLPSASVIQLAVGQNTSCVVTDTHYAYCWGHNASGQLGDGTSVTPSSPRQAVAVFFDTPTSVSSIDTGYNHTCAIATNGQAYCWGRNADGELGNGTTGSDVLVPTLVADPYM